MTGDAVEQTITAETITELRRLLANATPGPWVTYCGTSPDFGVGVNADDGVWSLAEGFYSYDADLIVAAVNALPALLDELDRLAVAVRGTQADAVEQLAVELEGRCEHRSHAPDTGCEWIEAAAIARARIRSGEDTPSDHVEPGCTCGGMAACPQCQDRDAAVAPQSKEDNS